MIQVYDIFREALSGKRGCFLPSGVRANTILLGRKFIPIDLRILTGVGETDISACGISYWLPGSRCFLEVSLSGVFPPPR